MTYAYWMHLTMNEFTKEELQEIHKQLKNVTKSDFIPYSCLTLALKKKIQSMIDNYCDHEPELSQEICCTKCQRTLI